MRRVAIQGSQWGDEGKGKITDFFSSQADIVVRYQGGNNAGHTIVFDNKKFAVRLLPSGIFHKNVICVLASGMVISPKDFFEEVETLKKAGYDTSRILISDRASVLLPYHRILDSVNEKVLDKQKIGTTGKGIGPCYTDKASRIGLRMGEMVDPDILKNHLKKALEFKNRELRSYNLEEIDFDELYQECLNYGEKLKPYVTDTSIYLSDAIKANKRILFEGAQGAMLCLTHGTYPYVTSSSPMSISIPLNCGIPTKSLDYTLGIAKAYTTRVGDGPFPSELFDDIGNLIREKGHEYGTVTKRPRRIGWLDINVLNHAARISGVDGWAITLLDVLTGLKEIKICVSYKYKDKILHTIPSTLEEYSEYVPQYIVMSGWEDDISNVKTFDDLPENAKNYLNKIVELTNVPLAMFSVGPSREQTIVLYNPFQE